jgi:hypothetical protein
VLRLATESSQRVDAKTEELLRLGHEPPEIRERDTSVQTSRPVRSATDYLISGIRWIGLLLGVGLIYVALFLYEDESGKLQNRLENWWIRGHDAEDLYVAKHLRFIRRLAATGNKIMVTIFGDRIHSLRAVVVSVCFALCSLSLYQHINGWASPLDNRLAWAGVWFLLGMSPVFLIEPLERFAGYVIVGLILWRDYIESNLLVIGISFLIDQPILIWAITGFMLAVLFGILFAFLSFLVIRVVLKKIESSGGLMSTVLWLAAICLPGLLFYQPVYLMWLIPDTASPILATSSFVVLLMLGLINSFLLIPSILFLALTLTLLIHKIIWALANRSIYAFQKHEVAKRNKLVFVAGMFLGLFGLGIESRALALLDKLI